MNRPFDEPAFDELLQTQFTTLEHFYGAQQNLSSLHKIGCHETS
jgi:hypothetical protein